MKRGSSIVAGSNVRYSPHSGTRLDRCDLSDGNTANRAGPESSTAAVAPTAKREHGALWKEYLISWENVKKGSELEAFYSPDL